MEHVYLFSYDWRAFGGGGTGHTDVALPHPLRPSDISGLTAKIKANAERNLGLSGISITILNIYKFEPAPGAELLDKMAAENASMPSPVPTTDALPDATERARQRGLGE